MNAMKILSAVLLTATVASWIALPAMAQPATRPPVCLDLRNIDGTDSKDGKILTFHMRDGSIIKNHLKQQCNGLVFGGFSWMMRGGGTNDVCEDAQTLRVLQTGEICALGKFDPPVKAASIKEH